MYTCDFSRGIGNSLDLVHHGGASRGIGNSLDLVHHGGASEVIIAKPQLHRRHDHFLRSVAIFFQNGSSFFLERGQFGGGDRGQPATGRKRYWTLADRLVLSAI